MPGDCRLIGGAAGGGPDRNPAREAKRHGKILVTNSASLEVEIENPVQDVVPSEGKTRKINDNYSMIVVLWSVLTLCKVVWSRINLPLKL